MAKMISNYIDELNKAGKEKNTLATYQASLNTFTDYLTLTKEKNVNMSVITDYKKYLEENYKQNTVRLKLVTLSGYCDFLMSKNKIKANPCPKYLLPKEEKNTVKAIHQEDLNIILKYLKTKEEYIQVLFYLMIYAGLRVGEVSEIRASDIIYTKNRLIVKVRKEITKGKKERISPYIDAETGTMILKYITEKSGKVSYISKRTIQYHAKQISEATQIKFSCHQLRHNYATMLLNQGVDIDIIQKALGHENITTTMRYAETLQDRIINVAAEIKRGEKNGTDNKKL